MARPREFDLAKAVSTAMELFWRGGYEGTSLTDLTEAIGITAPSFYAAFGNKEGLFKRALAQYRTQHLHYVEEAFSKPTARAVAETLLYGMADNHTEPNCPHGCLVLNSSLPVANSVDPVRRELGKLRDHARGELTKRFQKAKAERDLPSKANPEALARYLLAVGYGMAVDAQFGASRKDLYVLAATALKAFSVFDE